MKQLTALATLLIDGSIRAEEDHMSEIITFSEDLDMFQNIIILYMDENGDRYIGNTSYYNGRGNACDYLSVMYRDKLPADMEVVQGWNWLDDNSARIALIPEESMRVGVEDFLAARGLVKDWKTLDYHVIEDYTGIHQYFSRNPLKPGQIIGFGIRK